MGLGMCDFNASCTQKCTSGLRLQLFIAALYEAFIFYLKGNNEGLSETMVRLEGPLTCPGLWFWDLMKHPHANQWGRLAPMGDTRQC